MNMLTRRNAIVSLAGSILAGWFGARAAKAANELVAAKSDPADLTFEDLGDEIMWLGEDADGRPRTLAIRHGLLRFNGGDPVRVYIPTE